MLLLIDKPVRCSNTCNSQWNFYHRILLNFETFNKHAVNSWRGRHTKSSLCCSIFSCDDRSKVTKEPAHYTSGGGFSHINLWGNHKTHARLVIKLTGITILGMMEKTLPIFLMMIGIKHFLSILYSYVIPIVICFKFFVRIAIMFFAPLRLEMFNFEFLLISFVVFI